MDIVELLLMRPWCFHIIHLKFDVSGYHIRLDGAEVIPNDLRVREQVAHLDTPDTCACSKIQDPTGISEGCRMEPPMSCFHGHFMVDIHTILLLFIIWKEVSAFPEGMVTAAVLSGIIKHAGTEGRGVGGTG